MDVLGGEAWNVLEAEAALHEKKTRMPASQIRYWSQSRTQRGAAHIMHATGTSKPCTWRSPT